MSEPAAVTFLSWLRRGIGTRIEIPDEVGSSTGRVSVPIQLRFNDALDAEVRLDLHGPGEVTGLDARAVIRVWPARDVLDAEANRFPLVEFDQSDLPWRYTPARASERGRLRPWLCLIALREDEVARYDESTRDRPLAAVTIRAGTPLPRLDQSWAWAHVQVSGASSIDEAGLAQLLDQEPERVVARILCPRRLAASTRYSALLVPVFEHGRRSGLRLPLGDATNALAPAWSGDDAQVVLPVYYRWRFQTGTAGAFEELARRLRPRRLPASVGRRDMDVSAPGGGLPAAASTPLGVEAALRSPEMESSEWLAAERDPFVERLGAILNLPAEALEGGGELVAAPPLYGRWPARQERLRSGEAPHWFQQLNSDPRSRVAAGLGTRVVQAQQQQLMAAAWDQAGDLLEVNDRLRHAQLGREVSVRLHERHLAALPPEAALIVTAPVHARMRGSSATINALVGESPVTNGLVSSQWRRVTRPDGPIARRQSRAKPSSALARTNEGELQAAPLPSPSEHLITHATIGERLVPPGVDAGSPDRLRHGARLLRFAAVALIMAAIFVGGIDVIGAVIVLGALAVASIAASVAAGRRAASLSRRLALVDGRPTPGQVEEIPPRPSFVARDPVLGDLPSGPPLSAQPEDSPSARDFRQAVATLAARRMVAPAAGPVRRPVDLAGLRDTVLASLDPAMTVPASWRGRLHLAPGRMRNPIDPIEPLMAGPRFRQPMYRPLAEISPDWILPGLDKVPPDTAALVVTNPRFVEAYLVGLNHEMTRELLWNEYPTGQRGTYFRQFWDPAGHVRSTETPSDPDALADIRPVHQWAPTARLGDNSARPTAPDGRHLVLLLRGEVLRRHPHTLVYAVRARLEDGTRVLGDEERTPLFTGSLSPDVAFFGFDLPEREARGSGGGEGWFFVLQEQPGEPHFGLDVAGGAGPMLASWSDLSWAHLVAPGADLASIAYVDLDADRPDTSAIDDPAGARWHAEHGLGPAGARGADLAYITRRRPVRVALHAADMLPPEEP